MSDIILNILIVAADDLVAGDLQSTLRRTGFSVAGVARSGDEAILLAGNLKPDLALVDLRLVDGLDGVETAREIRHQFELPVVFLTSSSPSDVELDRARSAAPSGYLRRPYSDGELVAVIEAAYGKTNTDDQDSVEMGDVFQSLTDAVIVTNFSDEVVFLNSAASELVGWSAEEAVGERLSEVAPMTMGVNSPFASLIPRTGGKRPVLRETAPLRTSGDDEVGTVLVLRDLRQQSDDQPPQELIDISERESFREMMGLRSEAESVEKLLPSEIAIAMEKIVDPFVMMTSQFRVTYANAAALVAFGSSRPLMGNPFWDNFSGETRERFAASFAQPLESREGRVVFDFEVPDTRRWYETSLYPTAEEGGMLALFHDITDRKRLEADRVRTQRLEGLGLLARGFAHEFNNLLTVLVGNLSLARERYPDDSDFQEEMQAVEGATGVAQNLVQQLLTFARGGQPVREDIAVPALLRRVLDDHRRENPKIRYQFQCNDSGLEASIDPEQVVRLLENLIINAEQAMPNGGTLIARCGSAGAGEAARLKGAAVKATDDHLVLEIIDTGGGMPGDVLDRAFDPYFSTREEANASGIGLTVCESIAKAHGGFILLQSKADRGTIATFCMPLSSPEKPLLSPTEAAAAAARKMSTAAGKKTFGSVLESPGSRILVLEDDAMIRRLISFTLQRDGHEVVQTSEGSETIRMFHEARDCGQPFDLFVSDLTIEGGLGGVETMRELRSIDPDLIAIASSGYSDAPAMARPNEFGFAASLPKPYPPRDLRRLVTRLLGARAVIG